MRTRAKTRMTMQEPEWVTQNNLIFKSVLESQKTLVGALNSTDSNKKVRQMKKELDKKEELLQKAAKDVENAMNTAEKAEESAKEAKEALAKAEEANTKLEAYLKKKEEELQGKNESNVQLNDSIKEKESELTKAQADLATLRGELKDSQQELKDAKSELSSTKNEIATKTRALDTANKDLESVRNSLEKANSAATEAKQQAEAAQEKATEAQQTANELKKAEENLAKAEKKAEELNKKVLKLETSIKESDISLNAATSEKNEVSGELEQTKEELEKAQTEIIALKEKLYQKESEVKNTADEVAKKAVDAETSKENAESSAKSISGSDNVRADDDAKGEEEEEEEDETSSGEENSGDEMNAGAQPTSSNDAQGVPQATGLPPVSPPAQTAEDLEEKASNLKWDKLKQSMKEQLEAKKFAFDQKMGNIAAVKKNTGFDFDKLKNTTSGKSLKLSQLLKPIRDALGIRNDSKLVFSYSGENPLKGIQDKTFEDWFQQLKDAIVNNTEKLAAKAMHIASMPAGELSMRKWSSVVSAAESLFVQADMPFRSFWSWLTDDMQSGPNLSLGVLDMSTADPRLLEDVSHVIALGQGTGVRHAYTGSSFHELRPGVFAFEDVEYAVPPDTPLTDWIEFYFRHDLEEVRASSASARIESRELPKDQVDAVAALLTPHVQARLRSRASPNPLKRAYAKVLSATWALYADEAHADSSMFSPEDLHLFFYVKHVRQMIYLLSALMPNDVTAWSKRLFADSQPPVLYDASLYEALQNLYEYADPPEDADVFARAAEGPNGILSSGSSFVFDHEPSPYLVEELILLTREGFQGMEHLRERAQSVGEVVALMKTIPLGLASSLRKSRYGHERWVHYGNFLRGVVAKSQPRSHDDGDADERITGPLRIALYADGTLLVFDASSRRVVQPRTAQVYVSDRGEVMLSPQFSRASVRLSKGAHNVAPLLSVSEIALTSHDDYDKEFPSWEETFSLDGSRWVRSEDGAELTILGLGRVEFAGDGRRMWVVYDALRDGNTVKVTYRELHEQGGWERQ